MLNNISKSILNTVCYYDVLNYPLTLFEIWKYLLRAEEDETETGERKKGNSGKFDFEDENEKYSLENILEELDNNNNLKAFIKSKNGFYFLKGREFLVERRIKKDKLSVGKIKRLRFFVSVLRISPFLRMIMITGRLAMKNAEIKSDWDVLIVLKSGRIWSGRTAITMLSHLLGKRRHSDKIKNRICLNYFITDKSLEIRNKDLFSANEYYFGIPIFDTGNYFKKFQLKNKWIKKYKPNYYPAETAHLKAVKDTVITKKVRKFLETLFNFDWLEKYLQKIESEKIKRNPKTNKENGFIEFDDKALIFLPEPQGPRIFEEFKNGVNKIWR